MIEFELPPALPESPPPIDPQTRIADETTIWQDILADL